MGLRIAKQYTFEAGHWLPRVPQGHKCRRPHGHNYTIELVCAGPVGPEGFIVDYFDIDEAWRPVFETLDHRMLNDVEGLENPTVEFLAMWVACRMRDALPSLVAVRAAETQDTWCEYTL